jgi:hypothetical protein
MLEFAGDGVDPAVLFKARAGLFKIEGHSRPQVTMMGVKKRYGILVGSGFQE